MVGGIITPLVMAMATSSSMSSKAVTNNNNYNDNIKSTFLTHRSFHVKDILDKYDGFILDQWGVMHDGVKGIAGAPECVRYLAEEGGKKLIILSNSSACSLETLKKLPGIGFNPDHFMGAVTSGGKATEYVRKTFVDKKALWFTWYETSKQPSPADFLRRCGNIQVTTNPKEADFVLLQGSEILRGGNGNHLEEVSLGSFFRSGNLEENIFSLLEKCSKRDLPMVVGNPDFVVVNPDGVEVHMPGKIARLYEEEFDGNCIRFGKPCVDLFEGCVEELGLPKNKIAHVGDSMHHDIGGAIASGIDSIFVVGGIHRQELGSELGVLPNDEDLCEFFTKYGQSPTHVIPMFKL